MNIEDYIQIGVRDGMDEEDILENLYLMGLIEAGLDDFGQPYAYDKEMYDLIEKIRRETVLNVKSPGCSGWFPRNEGDNEMLRNI